MSIEMTKDEVINYGLKIFEEIGKLSLDLEFGTYI